MAYTDDPIDPSELHIRHVKPKGFEIPENKDSHIKTIIGVVSGKGGVGKSTVTSELALCAAATGLKTAVFDADITGPSIPSIFGLKNQAQSRGDEILPEVTSGGIKVMSINLLLDTPDQPVLWRGPILGNVIKQFYSDVVWGDIDVMFVDMPPGTGDIPLTVFQSIPLNGVVIVTTPGRMVNTVVAKSVNMAKSMYVPVLGLVENMSYFQCPECGSRHGIFGKSCADELAEDYDIKHVLKLPVDLDTAPAEGEGSLTSAPEEMNEFLKTLLSEAEKNTTSHS